jgi:hypothetical protein
MAATDFAERSVGLSSGVKANIPMTREALVLAWCMAEPHARNQLAMLGLFILYLGAMYLAGLLANWLLKPPCLVLDMF